MLNLNNNGCQSLRRLSIEARLWPNSNIADYLGILADEWEALITLVRDHDANLIEACLSQKKSGACANVGMCDSCPREWLISD